ncbi:hypothetical protein [Paractinoplanes atraurantiacus]|uniref:Uncharacterized protein n=1 Tax=Paractinoplanes atraurantiacus TaxID=1036182 RepID=A0A285KQB4_9ACTN|nr:hypothetical protein [Actinoplanes atraurantiacus]SNY73491.1 hypothetical protein SAMN05421748_14719 [Actinoplanes atraurantiacus]
MYAPAEQVIDLILQNAARATLPFREEPGGRLQGTAFWYNDLIEGEVYVQYLLTAEALTSFDVAAWTLRPELADPAPSAQGALTLDFAAQWKRLPRIGVAAMPAAHMHAYADRKGWRWTTDEITDGLAATESDIATIGRTPVPAYVLGHYAGGERDQIVVVGEVALDQRGRLRWNGDILAGLVGAPVFTDIPRPGGSSKLVCLGVALPDEIAPFDRIRKEVAALRARPGRRWWKRG